MQNRTPGALRLSAHARAGRYFRMADALRTLAYATPAGAARDEALDLASGWLLLANIVRNEDSRPGA